jgi:hypothetical protein
MSLRGGCCPKQHPAYLMAIVFLAYTQSRKVVRAQKIFVQQPGSGDARGDLVLAIGTDLHNF